MIAQIKRAACETSKNTIYVADGDLPTLYDQWKACLLWINYNWRLKQAEGMGRRIDPKSQALKTTVPKGVASTSVLTQKTLSGTTYRGAGAPMDISAATAMTKCYRCGKLSHFKRDCPNAPKTREEALHQLNTYWDHHPTVEVNGNSRGGKRGCREVIDSTYSAKDLVSTGTHVTPDKCTYISVVSTEHSNIPATSQPDQELSKNHPGPQELAVVVKLLAKRLTSNPLRVKANDESPTIAISIIMVLHQSSGSRGVHAVTNERLDGTGEQAPSAPPGKTALQSPCLTGSFEGIAATKPPSGKRDYHMVAKV